MGKAPKGYYSHANSQYKLTSTQVSFTLKLIFLKFGENDLVS